MKVTLTERPLRKYIGTYTPKADALEKASGKTIFFDDLALKSQNPAMLYCKVLKSPFANARIVGMDTSKAEKYPGVYGVLRYDDPDVVNLKPFTRLWTNNQLSPYETARYFKVLDRRILDSRARWVGEEMGVAVAAETEEIAEEALKLVEIQWEQLGPAFLEVEECKKPEASNLHPEFGLNNNRVPLCERELPEGVFIKGDIDKGFEEAEEIIELSGTTGGCTIQGRLDRYGAIASWDGDKLNVWASAFFKDQLRLVLHAMLNTPISKIRVRNGNMGGNFGKANNGDHEYYIIIAILSKRIGKPIKYRDDLREELAGPRSKVTWSLKMGAKKNGEITALDFRGEGNAGAYCAAIEADCGFFIEISSGSLWGHVPNVRGLYNNYYTNRLPGGIMRGIGNIQVNFTLTQAVDMMAEKLGMDPVEFAIMNFGDMYTPKPHQSLSAVLKEGAARIGWENRHKTGEGPLSGSNKKRGMGMSFWNQWHAEWQQGERGRLEISIKLNPDLSVILDAPTVETGNGANTVSVLACAEALDFLNVKPKDITWIAIGDSESGLRDCHPTDSSVSLLHAELIARGGLKIKEELCKRGAEKLNVNPDQMDIKDARVFIKENPEQYVTARSLIMDDDAVPIFVHLVDKPNLEITGLPFGAWFAEVEVDTETGVVEVLKLVILNDGGTILNASGAEGHQLGAQCIGIGEALIEELAYDKATGIALNLNYIDYKMPTIADFPDVEPVPMEVWKGAGEYGAAGLAEGTASGTPAAIANAIYNAVGIRIQSLPFSPKKVLEALAEKEKSMTDLQKEGE